MQCARELTVPRTDGGVSYAIGAGFDGAEVAEKAQISLPTHIA